MDVPIVQLDAATAPLLSTVATDVFHAAIDAERLPAFPAEPTRIAFLTHQSDQASGGLVVGRNRALEQLIPDGPPQLFVRASGSPHPTSGAPSPHANGTRPSQPAQRMARARCS